MVYHHGWYTPQERQPLPHPIPQPTLWRIDLTLTHPGIDCNTIPPVLLVRQLTTGHIFFDIQHVMQYTTSPMPPNFHHRHFVTLPPPHVHVV